MRAEHFARDELFTYLTVHTWNGFSRDADASWGMAPSAMIFARSINGLSHCEQEYSTPEDLEAGANVLLRAGLGEVKYQPCPLLRRMVEAGQLGRKTGRGFYEYS